MEDDSEIDWEMVTNQHRQTRYEDCSVFPPSNHEGLHFTLREQPQQQQQEEDEQEENDPPIPEPPSSLSNIEEESPLRQPSDSRLRPTRDFVMKRLSLGFELLCSKLTRIAISVRSFTVSRAANGSSLVSVAVTLLVSLLCLRWQRWRRRSRQQKKDRLIHLIREQDEKINQLLNQISQLNEVVSGSRRVPVLRSG